MIRVLTWYPFLTIDLLLDYRLVELEASFSEYSSVCTDAAHNYTEEKLAALRRRLNHLMSDKLPTTKQQQQCVPALQLEDSPRTTVPAEETEVGSDPEATLTRERAKKKKNKGRKHPWALDDQDDNESNMSSQASPGSIEISPEKSDPFKSSMESGFATMDTERSHQGGSTDGDLPSENQREPETSSPVDRRVSDREEFVPSDDQQQSAADSLFSTDADNNLSPAEDVQESAEILYPADTHPTESENVPEQELSTKPKMEDNAILTAPMEPLSVDVEGHDTGTSDHQTPPTVEDLAPSLPITDQEKLNVAKHSKKNKRNRKKKKGVIAAAAADETQAKVESNTPELAVRSEAAASPERQLPVSAQQHDAPVEGVVHVDTPAKQDQSTSTDMVAMESVELQTVNSPLLADSSTNTELNSNAMSVPSQGIIQNDGEPLDANFQSQGVATTSQSRSNNANQTETIPTNDEYTSMVPPLSMEQQTDLSSLHDVGDDKSTNTPRKTDSESQTTLTSSPRSSPRSKHSTSLHDTAAQTDDVTDGADSTATRLDQSSGPGLEESGSAEDITTPPAPADITDSPAPTSVIPQDPASTSSQKDQKSPVASDPAKDAKQPSSSPPSSTKKKDKKRRKKGKAKYEAILREPTPEPVQLGDEPASGSIVPAVSDSSEGAEPVNQEPDQGVIVGGDLPHVQPSPEPELSAAGDLEEESGLEGNYYPTVDSSETHEEVHIRPEGDKEVVEHRINNEQDQLVSEDPDAHNQQIRDNSNKPINDEEVSNQPITDEETPSQPITDESLLPAMDDNDQTDDVGVFISGHTEDTSSPVDDEVVPVVEPEVVRETKLRHRKQKVAASPTTVPKPDVEIETTAATAKPPSR